jgi:hypothetical protein
MSDVMGSRSGLLEREQEIMRLLGLLLDQRLNFIVVGGYAISTFKKRFSMDLYLVIQEEDIQKYEKLLEKEGFSLSYEKKMELLYGENFKRYGKKIKSLPVNADLLINGLVSRATNSTWSFKYIRKYSTIRKLNELKFLVPNKELLIAMKLHAGRLSDIRDVVALMPCNKEELRKHLLKGNLKKLEMLMKKQASFLARPQFDDSFKGIFGIHVYNERDVQKTKELIKKKKNPISFGKRNLKIKKKQKKNLLTNLLYPIVRTKHKLNQNKKLT